MTKAAVAQSPPGHSTEPARALGKVIETFQRWLYLPDREPLLAVLGGVAANLLPGDPVWLLLVGPPGGGKSELLQGLAGLPKVHPTATVTEPALLSGTAKRERATGAKGGLLREIGDFGIILCKDFGSVLNMNRDARAAVLAALREIYDGSWTRHLGTDGGQTLSWSGKVGLIAGSTPTIDRHHAVMGAMGERFLLFRLPETESDEQARRALAHSGHEVRMRAEIAATVNSLFEQDFANDNGGLTGSETEALVSLSGLVARCRSAVERDGYSRDIELIPDSESPTRLVVALERLFAGLTAIGVSRPEAWSVVTKAALDSMPALRRRALGLLLERNEPTETGDVAEALQYPTSTTRRALEDLAAHGVAHRQRQGQGQADLWSASDWAAARWRALNAGSGDGR